MFVAEVGFADLNTLVGSEDFVASADDAVVGSAGVADVGLAVAEGRRRGVLGGGGGDGVGGGVGGRGVGQLHVGQHLLDRGGEVVLEVARELALGGEAATINIMSES